MRTLCLCAAVAALAWAAPAQASTLTPIGSAAQLGKVVQVTAAGDTLAIGAVQGGRFAVWLAAPDGAGLRRVADEDEYGAYFDLTPDARYLLLGDRRFDLQSSSPSVIPVSAFQRILSSDGSVFFATDQGLHRLGPDGAVTDVPVRRLKGTAWAAAGNGEPGARGLGWCGVIDHRATLGLLDPATGRVSLKSTGVRAQGITACVTSSDGSTTGTMAFARPREVLVLRSARGGIHRYPLRRTSQLWLSPGGRYALTGDLALKTSGVCLHAGFGGVNIYDTVSGRRRFVRFHGCAGRPMWDGDAHLALATARTLLVIDPATGRTRRIGALDRHSPTPVAFAPGGRIVFGARAWYSATPASQPAALSGSLFKGLWFGAGRAYVTDPSGALFTTPAEGFGKTALVR